MDFDNIKNDDKTLNFLTGISNVHLFKWVLSLIKPNVELTGKSITDEKPSFACINEIKTKTWHLDLIQMLPLSQTSSELT